MCQVIGEHRWLQYLQPLGNLGVATDSVDLRLVASILLDFVTDHCKRTCRQCVNNITIHTEETQHNLINKTNHNESDIKRLITASINTLINYLKHKHQPLDTTPKTVEIGDPSTLWTVENGGSPSSTPNTEEKNNEISCSQSSLSSDRVLADLLNYSNITETSPSVDSGVTDSQVSTSKRKNRKSKKGIKHPHNTQRCVTPECFSCATENVVNLTGRALSRQQITLLSRGLSFIPKTPERELMTDLGTFIRNTKIQCGKLLVRSQREQSRKDKHVKGTPRLAPNYEREGQQQKEWPSNRLLSSQMEDNFHAMRQELVAPGRQRIRQSKETIIQPNQKRTPGPGKIFQNRFPGIQKG